MWSTKFCTVLHFFALFGLHLLHSCFVLYLFEYSSVFSDYPLYDIQSMCYITNTVLVDIIDISCLPERKVDIPFIQITQAKR